MTFLFDPWGGEGEGVLLKLSRQVEMLNVNLEFALEISLFVFYLNSQFNWNRNGTYKVEPCEGPLSLAGYLIDWLNHVMSKFSPKVTRDFHWFLLAAKISRFESLRTKFPFGLLNHKQLRWRVNGIPLGVKGFAKKGWERSFGLSWCLMMPYFGLSRKTSLH